MPHRLILAFLPLATLAGCNQQPAGNEETPRDAKAAPADAPAPPSIDDRAELTRELALTAQMLNRQMPLRQQGPQGMVTVTGIEANGTELLHRVQVPADLDPGSFEQFRAQLPARLCENSAVRQAIARGGIYTYVMRDRDNEEYRASVDRCDVAVPVPPPAPGTAPAP